MAPPLTLNSRNLSRLDPRIVRPQYARDQLSAGIVHIGVGNFHRAHQAVYTDEVLHGGDQRWGIVGVNLHSQTLKAQLAPQDTLYSVLTRDSEAGEQLRVIGSLMKLYAVADGDTSAVVNQIADPTTRVITLTITEKGYCLRHGELDTSRSDVQHDLGHPQAPATALGLLAAGLAARAARNGGPITILSCDNLAGNGRVLARVLRAFVAECNPELGAWLQDQVSCPSTMVDRIVPATQASDLQGLEQQYGLCDAGLVTCEPFNQWVIEDHFVGPRPPWDMAGALWVNDVAPFEQMKLRLLNASHSALAYLGLLAGYEYIHAALADRAIARFIDHLFSAELLPLVPAPGGIELEQYTNSIKQRFSNQAVPYTTRQVATDGAQKLPQRILPSLHQALDEGRPGRGLLLVTAAWLKCLYGRTDDGAPLDFSDPTASDLKDFIASNAPTPRDLVQFAIDHTPHLDSCAHHAALVDELTDTLDRLCTHGVQACLAEY